jgi:DNA polymerase-1
MTHLLLRRVDGRVEEHGDDRVEAIELSDGGEVVGVTRLGTDDLASFVRAHEPGRPRWTWDDTARWYPGLLREGVRVERCWDLRLVHDLLRRSPLASLPDEPGGEAARWDALRPAVDTDDDLFAGHDLGDRLDPLAEHARQQAALASSPDRAALGLLVAAESSGALVAAEMTHAGLPWRADVHDELLTGLLGPRPVGGARPPVLERLVAEVRAALDAPALNPDSQAAVLHALRAAGLDVADTRSWTLEQLDHPGAALLLEYKKLARLLSTNGWQWLDTWVHAGRFRPDYLVGGVVTGRWSSRGGGALTVPGPVRPAVVADDGWRLVVADAAQLEPRVLAGMSRDPAMAAAGRGRDLYAGMVADGAVATRGDAKLGMLGAMYGGTRGESGRMATRMSRSYPAAVGLVEAAARAGERGEVVRTLLGRGSPVPTGSWTEEGSEVPRDVEAETRSRRAWGRFTRNFVVQGTAAEWALCWLALLRNRLWDLPHDPTHGADLTARPHLVMFLHDEVVVHAPEPMAAQVEDAVRAAATEAGRLLFGDFPVDFPLDVRTVRSWADAT